MRHLWFWVMTLALLYIACEPHSCSHFCIGKLPTLPPFLVSILATYLFRFIFLIWLYTFYMITRFTLAIGAFRSNCTYINLSIYMDIVECEALGWQSSVWQPVTADYLSGGGGGGGWSSVWQPVTAILSVRAVCEEVGMIVVCVTARNGHTNRVIV